MKLKAEVKVFAMGFIVLQFDSKTHDRKEIISILADKLYQPGTYVVKVKVWILKAANLFINLQWEYKIPVTPRHNSTTITFK